MADEKDEKRKRSDRAEIRWTSDGIAVARVTIKGRDRQPFLPHAGLQDKPRS